MPDLRQLVDDTYAEGFRSIYGEVLLTGRDETWLRHAVAAVTGHASSTILCDCEAGAARWLDSSQTPDGRPGCVIQFHVPRFRKDRREQLEKVMLARLSQNALTCPTIRCFNRLDTEDYFKLGRKIALFGDGHQFRDIRYDERGWVIPILGGEFFLSRRFGFQDGVMGGNLWFFGGRPGWGLACFLGGQTFDGRNGSDENRFRPPPSGIGTPRRHTLPSR